MERIEQKKLVARSVEISSLLPEIEAFVFSWGERKGYDAQLMSQFSCLKPYLHHIIEPEEFFGMGLSQALMVLLFSRSRLLSSLLRGRRRQHLSIGAERILHYWRDESWYMTAFSVLSEEGSNILRIYDLDDHNEYILYSPAVYSLQKTEQSIFYTCLLYNGLCFQSYGGIFFLPWADEADYLYYARRVDEKLFERDGLMAVMNTHPVPWISLYPLSSMGELKHRDGPLRFYEGHYVRKKLDIETFLPSFHTQQKDGLYRFIEDVNAPRKAKCFLWKRSSGDLYLRAGSCEEYRELVSLLPSSLSLPTAAQSVYSESMETVASRILEPSGLQEMELLFEKASDSGRETLVPEFDSATDQVMSYFSLSDDIPAALHHELKTSLYIGMAMEMVRLFPGKNRLPATSTGNFRLNMVAVLEEKEKELVAPQGEEALALLESRLPARSENQRKVIHAVHLMLSFSGYIEDDGRALCLTGKGLRLREGRDLPQLYETLFLTYLAEFRFINRSPYVHLEYYQKLFPLFLHRLVYMSGGGRTAVSMRELIDDFKAVSPVTVKRKDRPDLQEFNDLFIGSLLEQLFFYDFLIPFGLMTRSAGFVNDSYEKHYYEATPLMRHFIRFA